MKTLIIYDQRGKSPVSFILVEGDKSHLNDVYINDYFKEELSNELYRTLYNPITGHSRELTIYYTFPALQVKRRNWIVIVAGIIS